MQSVTVTRQTSKFKIEGDPQLSFYKISVAPLAETYVFVVACASARALSSVDELDPYLGAGAGMGLFLM
jgi:hypothetical protein